MILLLLMLAVPYKLSYHALIFDSMLFIKFRQSFSTPIYFRTLSLSPTIYSLSSSSESNSLYTYKLFTNIFSHEFLQWFTRKVTTVFGIESFIFFFTTLKYDVISLFIIYVSVCSLSFALSPTFITVGTQGNLYLGNVLCSANDI